MNSIDAEILLVEDSPDDQELTIRALRKHNLANRIHAVRDGAEALDFLQARGAYAHREIGRLPKLVLLDLKLPRVDGLTVLKEIRSNPQICKVPVVVLTSSREEPDIRRCYELGANSYLVKPVGFEEFIKSVSDAGLYWMLLNEVPK